jgi:hypothetical protein
MMFTWECLADSAVRCRPPFLDVTIGPSGDTLVWR